jgi:hypothetical protein
MFALGATALIARALYFHFAPPLTNPLAFSGINAALLSLIPTALAGATLGFILIADERALADLEDAKDKALRSMMEVAEHEQAEAVLLAEIAR